MSDADLGGKGAEGTTGASPGQPLPPGMADITGPDEKLDAQALKTVLGRFVEGASVVAMGESVHNSEGYMSSRIAMTKILIEDHAARHLLLEQPSEALEGIDRYLQGSAGDPAALVAKLYWVWQSGSFVDFLRWIRRHNSDHPEAVVAIAGIDPKQPAADLARLDSRAGVDSALVGRLKRHLVGAGSLEETRAVIVAAIQKNQKLLSAEHKTECDRLIDELSDKVLAGGASSGCEKFQLLAALNGLKSWQGFIYQWPFSNELGASERDKGMARNVVNYRRFVMRPGERAVLWAHNFHISYDSPKIEINDDETKGSVLGRSLRETLGDSYRAIGLIGFKVGAALPKAAPKNYQAGAGSLEHALSALDRDLFIDTKAAGKRLDGKVLMSEIFSGDFVGQEYDTGSRMNPREQFSGLLFLRRSKPFIRDSP
ncbi:MAG: erythromycin esterase family protein [Elusimicrobia bacterium]|nr:erythromycin esterase family protein [Elusimicrobiota bacterium]